MIKPTRWYSKKQEKAVAKEVGGVQVSNSGATPFHKGDVISDNWLIECKTTTKDRKSFTLYEEWFDKNEEEAFAEGKSYSALAFNFGPDKKNYYVIDAKTFKKIKNIL